jgi:hypothetical protein
MPNNAFQKPESGNRPQKKILNHVIFLGAGASLSSGYPLANQLRLRLASEEQMLKELENHESSDDTPKIISAYYKEFADSIDLFRHGCFGTVDEFAYLASEKFPTSVLAMKQMTRLALSLHNPEWQFEKALYYPFVQKLFDSKTLNTLRPNITVMTYNYDFHLEHIILKAHGIRNKLSGKPESEQFYLNKLCGGFFMHPTADAVNALANAMPDFRYFKLHGSTGYAVDNTEFLLSKPHEIHLPLDIKFAKMDIPPIVFPWELFDEHEQFTKYNSFKLLNSSGTPAEEANLPLLYNLFSVVWNETKKSVMRANKISFVGLSGGQYLEAGLKFLFKDKAGPVEVVVANTANEIFKSSKIRLHPASLCGKYYKLLEKVAPRMTCVKSSSEDDGTITKEDCGEEIDADITPRYSFEDFIQFEMD